MYIWPCVCLCVWVSVCVWCVCVLLVYVWMHVCVVRVLLSMQTMAIIHTTRQAPAITTPTKRNHHYTNDNNHHYNVLHKLKEKASTLETTLNAVPLCRKRHWFTYMIYDESQIIYVNSTSTGKDRDTYIGSNTYTDVYVYTMLTNRHITGHM